MYRVKSPEWTMVIEDGFKTPAEADSWARRNCSERSCWDGVWELEYYEPENDRRMIVFD